MYLFRTTTKTVECEKYQSTMLKSIWEFNMTNHSRLFGFICKMGSPYTSSVIMLTMLVSYFLRPSSDKKMVLLANIQYLSSAGSHVGFSFFLQNSERFKEKKLNSDLRMCECCNCVKLCLSALKKQFET